MMLNFGGGLIIIIGLIFILIYYWKGNKEALADKVNTISFNDQRDDDHRLNFKRYQF